MKKFIYTFIYFCFFSTAIYLVLLFIWSEYASPIYKPNLKYRVSGGHLNSRLTEVKDVKNVDILFLGSSHAYRGFDTRIFKSNSYKTFNLGSGSQTPIETKILLNRYLDNLNPKLVLFEVYPKILSIDGVESSLDLISNDENDLYSIEMALDLNNIKTYNTLLYSISRDIIDLDASYTEPKHQNGDTYISGGYVEKEIAYFEPKVLPAQTLEFKESQLESFQDIIDIFEERNIEVILVFAPISKSLYKSYLDISDFNKLMKTYPNYYNFNKILQLNDSLHFYDEDHLNQRGVKIFNNKLIEILEKTEEF